MRFEECIRRLLFAVVLCFMAAGAATAQLWQDARLLNQSWETACKTAKLCASRNGGFHAVYFNTKPWQVQYRRYQGGYLGAIKVLDNNFVANPDICEAGNGDIHIVWEDWEDANYAGWGVSWDGGQTFTTGKLTTWDGAKYPLVAPFGPSSGPDVVMSVARSKQGYGKDLFYNRYDGSNWSGTTSMGSSFDNEYEIEGICRSLQDGTVYRSYGVKIGGAFSVCYRRYNGSYWEPQVVVAQPGFFSRQSIAVNPAGQIMVLYEGDNQVWTRLYTPGVGWAAPQAQEKLSTHSALTAVPGTNDFYLVYTYDMKRIYGVRHSGGGWLPKELVSVGLPDAFTVGADVSAGSDGTIYACWEYWGSGDCQQYYSVRSGGAPADSAIAGAVRDQFGMGIPGVTVGTGPYATISGAAGVYELRLPAGTYALSANKDYYTGQVIQSVVTVSGSTTPLDFHITAYPPAPVAVLNVSPSDGFNRLSWTNPASGNFYGTMIRCKSGGYPSSPTDGALVCDRTSLPGAADSYIHSGLTNGVTYYYTAFAHDDIPHFSSAVIGNGAPLKPKCSDAKQRPDDTVVDLVGKVVMANFAASDGCIYIAEPDRTSGIRVACFDAGLTPGSIVDVTGTVSSRVLSGYVAERQLSPATVTVRQSGGDGLGAVGLMCRNVGGGASGLSPGVVGGVGTNNMGLLVTIAGRVTAKITQYIYVDDGSKVMDPSGRTGVMVKCPDTNIPAKVGDTVSVTGIVEGSIPSGAVTNRRYVHMRTWNDLVLVRRL